ncbi:DUF1835 domain-containing protein [Aliamphritea hakodatensis]|uniref:DUF1835 domain-containing protein n=1 Tax=Aliamphritea hakodatensis TaxID=2895352 RepID=UPI0022FD6B4A|nr:DUF1835 domain-containing protein [Aliamphritea hakodatensis]
MHANANRPLTPPARPRDIFHGKLNLEQQKKRAKELLKQVRNQDSDAIQRFHAHPRTASLLSQIQLSHCQLIIARENGFDSWPAMKAHIDSLTLEPRTPDTPDTLHIRCGHDIQHGLQLAGFCGEYLAFTDPFCQGPVQDLPIEKLIQMRSRYVADAYSIDLADATAQAKAAYGPLQAFQARSGTAKWQNVVLWFEHDSYDQLILAFLLSYFFRHAPDAPLELICVDRVPGVNDFIGLGQLSPELFRYLWDKHRTPVSNAQLQLGENAWQALCSASPEALVRLAGTGTPALPLMARALHRHLAELPDPHTGLSLTASLALQLLSETDTLTAGKLFACYMREREPLPWLGDLMFWSVIRALTDTSEALIRITSDHPEWPQKTLSVTPTGRQVLKGEVNALTLMKQPRWVGGIRIPAATEKPS